LPHSIVLIKQQIVHLVVHVVDSGSVSSSVLSVDAKEFIPSALPEPSYYATDVRSFRAHAY